MAIIVAATVYSFGKAFFWPTSLGVVSEQSPRGGAITLNVVAGIGMLGAGVIGGPLIGKVLDGQMVHGVAAYDAKNNTQLVETLKIDRTGLFGDYTAIDPAKRATLAGDEKAAVDAADRESKHDALRTIAILPGIMFLVYLGLILYFRSRGGYKPVVLDLKKWKWGHSSFPSKRGRTSMAAERVMKILAAAIFFSGVSHGLLRAATRRGCAVRRAHARLSRWRCGRAQAALPLRR